ncbi:hypothetical protein VTO73DRAFT_9966 [Trametes versicolor]
MMWIWSATWAPESQFEDSVASHLMCCRTSRMSCFNANPSGDPLCERPKRKSALSSGSFDPGEDWQHQAVPRKTFEVQEMVDRTGGKREQFVPYCRRDLCIETLYR